MKTISLWFLIVVFLPAPRLEAQCPFDPVVTGKTILCPGESSELGTQAYDGYQWYRRQRGAPQATLIPGATDPTLKVGQGDVLYSFSVEVALNGCIERSPEVLVDGWLFLLPTVQHEGRFTFDPNTQTFRVCEGDTMLLTMGLPYVTNITWFRDGEPILGETGITYGVTRSGSYWVEGAPSVCPDFIVGLGVTLNVTVEPCGAPPGARLWVFPNPTRDQLRVVSLDHRPVGAVEVSDVRGRVVLRSDLAGEPQGTLSLAGLPAGLFWVRARLPGGQVVLKIVKK